MIRLNNVTKQYGKGGARALDSVCLEIERGERLAIVGKSGSGKTTLLSILGGLDTPTSGTLTIDGTVLSKSELSAFRRHRVGFMFQEYGLIDEMNVHENVEYARRLHPGGISTKEMLSRVGLSDKLCSMPESLSGGERQRVALARALVKTPELILLDEPTGALDRDTGDDVMELVFDLTHDMAATLVLVTHSASLAERTGRVVTLSDGRIAGDARV